MMTKTTPIAVQPYLFYNGRCEEAIAFYVKAIGAEVKFLMKFKDSPDPTMCPPGSADKVMHSTICIGGSEFMASDGGCDPKSGFEGFSLSIAVSSEGDAQRYFAALADGGVVQMPLTKTFFSPLFGMVQDRFGVCWMILVQCGPS